jgi:hypothetical protein
MPLVTTLRGRRVTLLNTAIADETNADAGTTWGAAESTLANSLKAKLNAVLAALRASGILSTTASGKIYTTSGITRTFFQSNITDEATANTDATYGQTPEGDLLNSMKTKINAVITALTASGVIGGHARYTRLKGRKVTTSAAITPITVANADATYTSGGEQALLNDEKRALNQVLAAMRAARILAG